MLISKKPDLIAFRSLNRKSVKRRKLSLYILILPQNRLFDHTDPILFWYSKQNQLIYYLLCDENPSKVKSVSEVDFFFCLE